METSKAPRSNRGATGDRLSTARPASEKGPEAYYLVVQGDVLELVTATERPSLDVQRGERRKTILASGTDKEMMEAKFRELAPRYTGVVGKGEAY